MNQISVSELKTNPSKYIAMLSEGDIYITKNNKSERINSSLIILKANIDL